VFVQSCPFRVVLFLTIVDPNKAEAAVARLLVVMERTRSRSSELAMGMTRLMSLLVSTSVEAGELSTLLRVRSGQARHGRRA
jgi:hypothetical protein